MMKRSLLAVAVTAITAQAAYAAPFMPMDARGLAMGNTGVASAKRAHAPAYNPSLLSQGHENDDFALLFPQLGVTAADEEELADEAELISDVIFPAFEAAIEGAGVSAGLDANLDTLTVRIGELETAIGTGNVAQINTANNNLSLALNDVDSDLTLTQSSISDLTNSLNSISGSPLSARLGLGGALAIPSKKFAAAVSISGTANVSARVDFSPEDSRLLNSYVPAAQGYIDRTEAVSQLIDTSTSDNNLTIQEASDLNDAVNDLQSYSYSTPGDDPIVIFQNGALSDTASDPDLKSTVDVVVAAVADVAISFSREFDIKGEKVAIGITPKLQKISTFHYVDEVDGFEDVDEDTLKDTQKDYTKFNLDIGASYRLGDSGKWMVGVVGKNLLGGSFDYETITVNGKTYEGSVELNPQFRAGVAYNGEWTSVAFDLDLVENDPVAFEAPTQFAAVGVELDVFSFMQLRAGYRTNLSASDASVASIGLGLSPFGVHLDIAAMANPSKPEKEAGIALETGFYF